MGVRHANRPRPSDPFPTRSRPQVRNPIVVHQLSPTLVATATIFRNIFLLLLRVIASNRQLWSGNIFLYEGRQVRRKVRPTCRCRQSLRCMCRNIFLDQPATVRGENIVIRDRE